MDSSWLCITIRIFIRALALGQAAGQMTPVAAESQCWLLQGQSGQNVPEKPLDTDSSAGGAEAIEGVITPC